MQYEIGAGYYLWHRAVEVVCIRDLEICRKWLVLGVLLQQVTIICFSHLAQECKRMYFIVTVHVDSCDLGVLFRGDRTGKGDKS